jgi:hypothetical protein
MNDNSVRYKIGQFSTYIYQLFSSNSKVLPSLEANTNRYIAKQIAVPINSIGIQNSLASWLTIKKFFSLSSYKILSKKIYSYFISNKKQVPNTIIHNNQSTEKQHSNQDMFEFNKAPKDIKKIIGLSNIDKTKVWYLLKAQSTGETCLTPYAHREIIPVKYTTMGSAKPEDMAAIPKQNYLPDVQVWYGCFMGYGRPSFRISKDTYNTEDIWNIPLEYSAGLAINVFVDGINNNERVLCGVERRTHFGLLAFECSKTAGEYCHTIKEAFYMQKDMLSSLLLHPNSNRFLCTGTMLDPKAIENPFFITLGYLPHSNDYNDVPEYIQWAVNHQFKKILYIGDNKKYNYSQYVGLTQEGKVASITYYAQNKARKDTLDIAIKQVLFTSDTQEEDMFEDIAIDNAYETSEGSKPRMAFLNKKGAVFVTDFRFNKRPTLFLMRDIPCAYDPSYANKYKTEEYKLPDLFYDKGQIGLLYKNKHEKKYNRLYVWPDNLDMYCITSSWCNQNNWTVQN